MFRILALTLCSLIPTILLAAAPTPPYPETYNVVIRYRIGTGGAQRIVQFREMKATLESLGFIRDPDDLKEKADFEQDNPKFTRLIGTLPGKALPRVLAHRRIQCVLLYPEKTTLPAKGTRVRVDVQLTKGYIPETQLKLFRDTSSVLTKDAGFIEGVLYDHREHSRLVGSVPVEKLDLLLEDVRRLPSAKDKEAPFTLNSPIQFTLAQPNWPVPTGMPKFPEVPAKQRKFSPELRALLADAMKAGDPRRLDVILGWTPRQNDQTWVRTLEIPGVTVEGWIGPLVTVYGTPKDIAPKLAELEDVAHVRIPIPAEKPRVETVDPKPINWEPLRASGLTQIHNMGKRGKGSRVAVISNDFTGWESLKGRKDGKKPLPDPTLVDLTAERDPNLLPDSFPETDDAEGYGTRCAKSILKAAPECELTLIRIDDLAPHMLQTIAAAINGSKPRTICLDRRLGELREDAEVLDRRGMELLDERRKIFSNPRADEKDWIDARDAYQQRQDAHDTAVKLYRQRRARYFKLQSDLDALKGIRVVASTIVWSEGFPMGGASALSQYFNDMPFRAALWFQAAGDNAGQAWSGIYRDGDGNGIMEFVDLKDKLPTKAWTPEINFLAWQPRNSGAVRDLPADTVVRLSMQWREAHDPLPLKSGQDPYREPLTKLRLYLVYQPDSEGKTRPGDDVDVIAATVKNPVRLDQSLSSATYEHTLEVKLSRPGRYGVFIEGTLSESISSSGENRLPAFQTKGEIRPRLFVETLKGSGRAVWGSFVTPGASLGTPADSRSVITVGAVDPMDRPRQSSPSGSPAGLALVQKPDTLSYDEGGGTGQAASFAAGLVGSAWPNTGSLFGVIERLRDKQGSILRVGPPRKR